MPDAFDRFREHVLADPGIQERLRGFRDREAFAAQVAEIAAEAGYHVTPQDVDAALREARREWLERWI